MKTLILIWTLLIALSVSAQSDERADKRAHKFTATLKTFKNESIEGRLVHLTDSSLVIAVRRYNSSKVQTIHNLDTVSYRNIQELSLHNRGGARVGSCIGAWSGAAIGLLIGNAVGHKELSEHPPTGFQIGDPIDEYLFEGAVYGLVAGGLIGAGIGASVNRNFEVAGDYNKFLAMKEKMKF